MSHINLIPGEQGVRLSTLSPKYLHTNSTSHTWPFSAMAELVDNAYDPDVEASQLWIDIKRYGSEYCLTFTDNGAGMNSLKLHKMLSFGFCEKVAKADHLPVGHYGNGFKSGSMRLGKDAIVFTKGEDQTQSVGFLSQTYLENINAQTILVPIVTWDSQGDVIERADGDKALQDILKYSLFKSKSQLHEQFNEIGSTSGTRIIISRMRKNQDGKSEFDFRTDTTDIRIPDDIESENNKYRRQERQNHIPESDFSLRAYCSILYLRPRMQIILRGKKVRTTVIAKSLSKTEVDAYRPNGVARSIRVTFGFSQNKNHYGIMMYHRNRLIKPYVRVGYQQKANNLGVGVIGVIKCDYLQPTHNKQDFDYTKAYRSLMSALGSKLNDYWNEKKGKTQVNSNAIIPEPKEVESVPDQLWVQCDNPECLKWRKLPLFVTSPDLPEKWYCLHHPDKKWRSCDVPEELEEGNEDSLQPYVKKQKKRLERELEETKRKEKEAKKVKELELEVKRHELQKREVELQRLMKSVEAKSKQQKEAMTKQQQKGNVKSEVASPQKLQIKVVGPASRQPGTTTQRKYIVQQTNGQRVILTPVDKQSKPQSFVVVKTMPGSAIRPANIVTTATPVVQTPSTSAAPRTNQTGLQIVKIISHGTPKSVIPTASVSNTKMIRPMHPKVAGSPVILKVSNQAAADHFNSLPTMVPVSAIVDPKVVAVQSLAPLKAQPLASTPAKTQPVKVNLMAQLQTSASYRPLESLKEVNRQAAQNTVSPVSAVVPDKNVLTTSSPTRRDVTVNDRFRYIVATGGKSTNSAPTSSNTSAPQVIAVQQVKTEQTPVAMTQVSGSQHLTDKAETLQSTVSTNVSPLKRSHNGSSIEAAPHPKISKIDSDIIVIDPPSPPTIQSISPQSASTSMLVKIEADNVNTMPSTNASTSGINESIPKADKIECTKPELQIGSDHHIPQIDKFITNKVKEMNPQQQLKALLSRTQQLHDLRANVCKLLRVLVPELEIDDQRESFEDQTVDELLKQVLQQAESS